MADRTFTAQRFNVVDGPAEPGFGWGVHTQCEEVRLTIRGDGTFLLRLGSYYNDWGDRNQDLILYEGTCEEHDEGIICRATSRTDDAYSHDHELGKTKKNRKRAACCERFDFRRRSDVVVVCPVDHGGLAGVTMSTTVEPMRDMRK